jgi:hypothetical protein
MFAGIERLLLYLPNPGWLQKQSKEKREALSLPLVVLTEQLKRVGCINTISLPIRGPRTVGSWTPHPALNASGTGRAERSDGQPLSFSASSARGA